MDEDLVADAEHTIASLTDDGVCIAMAPASDIVSKIASLAGLFTDFWQLGAMRLNLLPRKSAFMLSIQGPDSMRVK